MRRKSEPTTVRIPHSSFDNISPSATGDAYAYWGVKRFQFGRRSSGDDAVLRAPLPPIARELAWTEWLAVAGIWLALSLTLVGTLADNARSAGVGVAFDDFLAIQVIDWLAWMLLLWPLFLALDATPIAPPRRLAPSASAAS